MIYAVQVVKIKSIRPILVNIIYQHNNKQAKFEPLFNVWPGNLKSIVEVVISTYHIYLFTLLCEVVTPTIQF